MAVSIKELDELPGNPRRGDVDAVARSYEKFGQRKPIVARKQGKRGTVIAGNHQLLAARQLGWDEIAVVFVDDDDETAAAFALADNRTADLGTYDDADLLAMLESVNDQDLFLATGYDEDFLRTLITAQRPPVISDPDSAPELPASPVTRTGDIWTCNQHRVICGDSTDESVISRLMDGGKADMVWTDPPYGVAIVGGNHADSPEVRKAKGGKTIDNDGIDPEALYALLSASLKHALAVCRKGSAWFVAAPAGPPFLEFAKVLSELKVWRQTLVWEKQSLVMGRSDYHYRHEAIFYGWVPGARHTAPPGRAWDTIWTFDRPARSAEHPTMKPVALITLAIENHTKPDQIVLDPFGGSGSTLIAAHLTNRTARLVELDPGYCDVIAKRFQESTGEKPLRNDEPYDFLA